MRLLRIAAQNYRTLQDFELTFSSDYCTLSGQNNAGKSCVIKLVAHLLESSRLRWRGSEYSLDYGEDKTQWLKGQEPVSIEWNLRLSKNDDPALISFVETFAEKSIESDEVTLKVIIRIDHAGTTTTQAIVDGTTIDERGSREIVGRLRSSSCLFLHNSTEHEDRFFYGPGRRRAFYEIYLSEDEQKMLADAAKSVQRKTRQLARGHRDSLSEMLGKLADKYDVEFSTLEGHNAREMPLAINLKDKNVEVPLSDWGSGTQNRTYVLMSILQAKRIKDLDASAEKITPIVVVEEPESFLHPSAQAEFGKLLQELALELGIQIIVATHSPFMLNRVSPESNILLRRRLFRKKLQETEVVDTSGEDWMAPFSEHLGIVGPEFNSWRQLFSSADSRVLLVEGDLDKQYFEYMRENFPDQFALPNTVQVVPYGGKDALKNTLLLKFVLSKFEKVFITVDLDAAQEVKQNLEALGLEEKRDYLTVGDKKPGREAIEGLLPERVISAVFGRETDLVMQATSQDSKKRRDAKRKLKAKLLEEFKTRSDYSSEELKAFSSIGQTLGRVFA